MQQHQILNELTEEELAEVMKIVKEVANEGKSTTLNRLIYDDYKEIPVDIETFLRDYNYLGESWHNAEGKFKLYDKWLIELKKLFPNPYTTDWNQAIFTGAIGIGKSEVAVVCILYQLHRLMCLKDPYLFYDLKKTDVISLALLNVTKEASEGVAWQKLQESLMLSPWFKKRGKGIRGRVNKVWTPPDGLDLITGSQISDIRGRMIFSVFIDEISFGNANVRDIDKLKARAKELVDEAIARMQSRFIHGGGQDPTLLLLASSTLSDSSFLESYIVKKAEQAEKDTTIKTLLVTGAQWDYKDKSKYSGKKFKVAVGNKFLNSEIVNNGREEFYIQKGYRIINVPIEHKIPFIDDVDMALANLAGISTAGATKYINGSKWQQAIIRTRFNPFNNDVIVSGTNDKTPYWSHANFNIIPEELYSRPIFIHMDMSTTGDMTGIAAVAIKGLSTKPFNREHLEKGEELNISDIKYTLLFAVSIKAPKGYEISFEKHRQLLYYLRGKGWNIKGISFDQFQSADTGQILTDKGFNAKRISVDIVKDRVCAPYQVMRSAVYEQRFELLDIQRLTDEALDVERSPTGKIDHTPGFHKDALDAVTGALYHAFLNSEEFAFDYSEEFNSLLELNSDYGNDQYSKEGLTEAIRQAGAYQFNKKLQNNKEQSEALSNNKKPITPNEENSQTLVEMYQSNAEYTSLDSNWGREQIQTRKDETWIIDDDIIVF